MTSKSISEVDLPRLFNTVTRVLKENQQALNESDEYNHNHGDNMVRNFQVITRAVREKQTSQPAEQLEYASQLLSQRSQSGSAQLYSQGLAQAADRFKGKSAVTQEDAMLLVQALMGGQTATSPGQGSGMDLLSGLLDGQSGAFQSQPGGEDLLSGLLGGQGGNLQSQSSGGDLLGSLLGGQGSTTQSQSGGGDLLGGLLGAFMGGTPPVAQDTQSATSQGGGGVDLNMLLTAGMAFFKARQQGSAPLEALVQAVMAGSQMQSSTHHSQSGHLVAETLISTIGKMLGGKK